MISRRTGLMAAAVLVLGFMSAGASAKEPAPGASCARITEKQVEALFDRWNRALATKNPDTVVARAVSETRHRIRDRRKAEIESISGHAAHSEFGASRAA